MIQRINVTHAVTAAREAAIAAQDERWRRLDAQAAPPGPAAVKRPARAKPARRSPATASKPAAKPEVPPGYLLLSPPEVRALRNLLDLHPDLRG